MRIAILLALIVFGSMSLPVEASYRFQPGDMISFSVWDDKKMDRELLVAPDGQVSIPLVGQIKAAGFTAAGLSELLAKKLRKNYKTKPIVSIALLRQKPKEPDIAAAPAKEEEKILPMVYVTGEVKKAGGYPVSKPTTVLQAISLAGGLDIYAAKRRIKIQRKERDGDVIIPFDYLAATSGRDPWSNIVLRDGDVVVVPERGLLRGLF